MNSSEIVSMRGVTAATVSHHLKILSEAGLIICRREGQFVYSKAVIETIEVYTRALARIARGKREQRATDSRQSVGRTSWKYLDTPSARPDGSLIGEFRSLQNHSNFLLFRIARKLVTVGAGGRHGKYHD